MERVFSLVKDLVTQVIQRTISGHGILILMKQDQDGRRVRPAEYVPDLAKKTEELAQDNWSPENMESVYALMLPSPLDPAWTQYALAIYQNKGTEEETGRLAQIMAKEIAASKEFADWIWRNVQLTAGSMFHPILRWTDEADIVIDNVAIEPEPTDPEPEPQAVEPVEPVQKGSPIPGNPLADLPTDFWQTGDVYHLSTTKVQGDTKAWNGGFVLRAGAKILPEYKDLRYAPHVKACRERYQSEILDATTTEDLWFANASHLTGFIFGYSVTRHSLWKRDDGVEMENTRPRRSNRVVALERTPDFVQDPDIPEIFTLRVTKDKVQCVLGAQAQDGTRTATGCFARDGKGFILLHGAQGLEMVEEKEEEPFVLEDDKLFVHPGAAKTYIAEGRLFPLINWENEGSGRSFRECSNAYFKKYPEYLQLARTISA